MPISCLLHWPTMHGVRDKADTHTVVIFPISKCPRLPFEGQSTSSTPVTQPDEVTACGSNRAQGDRAQGDRAPPKVAVEIVMTPKVTKLEFTINCYQQLQSHSGLSM